MSFANAINTFFGSALIIIIIFAECVIKYSGDRILKKRFCAFLLITFFSLVADFLFSLFNKIPESIVSEKLIWPFMAALLLYIYLFIILKETKIDTLTGLDNRHSFFEYINRLSRNKTGDAWNIVILDIKNFKSINEIYGHLEGDNALRSLAEIIKTFVKKTDFAARYGGDEFAIVTKAEAGIEEMMNGINEELGRLNEKSKKLYNIEVSYESGVFTADGNMSIEKILNNIDKLMRKRHEESRRAGDLKAGVNA